MNVKVDLSRFEDSIRQLEGYPVIKDCLLLYGSSFFANWGYERSKNAFTGYRGSVNHGFGGATVDELLFYYNRLIRPYEPSDIILRTGINDLTKEYTPEETMLLFIRLCAWIRNDFPKTKIYALPIFDCPMLKQQTELIRPVREYNQLMLQYTENNDLVIFMDLTPFVYKNIEDIGQLERLRPLFLEDGLHLTNEGYNELEAYFRTIFV